jgi:phosphate transport system substrate-binding protein
LWRIDFVTITSIRPIAVLAVVGAVALGACSGSGSSSAPSTAPTAAASTGAGDPASTAPSQAALTGTITIDGSSTVYPITEAVTEEFNKVQPGVEVNVSESGTGGGFTKFCNDETDINDASRPIKADDAKEGAACKTKNISYVQLQVGIDGITVVVNKDNSFVTCLTVDQLKKIYGKDSPENLTWNQVDPSFPNQPVVRFMPGADSGTFDFFTEFINGKVDESTSFATQSEDDNVLVTGVAGDANGIGYFGYAYYVENQDKLKAVQVDAGGGCVAPTDATINDGSYKPLSRPLFIYPNTVKAKANPALAAYVDFYLANAATLAAEVGYVPVPESLAQQQLSNWTTAVPK